MFTVMITEEGPTLLTEPSTWYSADKVKTEKELEDEDLKKLLDTPISTVKSVGEVKASDKTSASKRVRRPKKD